MLSQRIRKRYYNTLGTSVIISPMSPPSLGKQRSIQTEMKGKQMTLMAAFKDGDTAPEKQFKI